MQARFYLTKGCAFDSSMPMFAEVDDATASACASVAIDGIPRYVVEVRRFVKQAKPPVVVERFDR